MDISVLTPHYEHFINIARGLLYKNKVPNHEDVAQDLVHDLLITMSQSKLQIENPVNYFSRSLHFQISINSSKFFYKYRRPCINRIGMTEFMPSEIFDISDKISDYYDERLLAESLTTLTEMERDFVASIYIEGKSIKEIAEEADIPYRVAIRSASAIKQKIKDEVKRIRRLN